MSQAVTAELTPEAISSLLEEALSPANAGAATNQLKRLLKEAAILPVLCQTLTNDNRPQVRQLAAVLLRQSVGSRFSRLAPEVKTVLRDQLLRRLSDETENLVRNAVAHLVVGVAKIDFFAWEKTLMPFLPQLASSPNAGHREAAMLTLSGLCEYVPNYIYSEFAKFIDLYVAALSDSSSARVRQTALKGIPHVLLLAESPAEYQAVRKLVAPMTDAVREAVSRHDEDVVSAALEVFDELAECPNIFNSEEISTLCKFMLTIAENKDLSVGVREQSLNFIHWVAKKKPKLLIKYNVVIDVLRVVVPMGAESSPFDDDDLNSTSEMSPHTVATQMVDSLAIFLPSKHVYYPVISALQSFTQSANPLEKRAALVLLGVMSEGCEDIMRRKFPELLPFVLSSMVSNNEVIQRAAAICFGQMAEYLQPEIARSSEQSINCLITALASPNELVKEAVCNAMELFITHLNPERITPVLPRLLPLLVEVLSSTPKPAVRESCLGVMAAACDAAKGEFEPYLAQIFSILDQAFQQPNASLCAGAIICAGSIAQSVGFASFAPYRERVTTIIMSIMDKFGDPTLDTATLKSDKIEQSELRAACYRYFGCLAFGMKNGFVGLLPKVAPWILATLTSRDGLETEYEDACDMLPLSDDEDADRSIRNVSIRTGFIEEQEAALDCLRILFENISGNYVSPIIEKSLEAMEILHHFFHSGIRELVPGVLQSILIGVHHANPPAWHQPLSTQTESQSFESLRGWVPGAPCKSPLSDETKRLWVEKIWPIYRAMLTEEDDKEVMGEVCRSLGQIIETLGPHLLDELMETHEHPQIALWVVTQVLSGNHVCQTDNEDNGIDDDEDSRALEELLFDGVSVLIGAVAQALGDQFDPLFTGLHPKILKLATHRKSCAYRSIGLGCYADVLKNMGSTAAKFIDPLVGPCLEAATQTVDSNLRRNACFCLGILIHIAPMHPTIRAKLVDILQALHATSSLDVTDLTEEELACVDNASAALCRAIMVLPSELIPLENLVPPLLKTLPVKYDMEETETVLRFLVFLLSSTALRRVAEANLVEILRVGVQVLTNKKSLESVKEGERNMLMVHIRNTVTRLGEGHEVIKRLGAIDSIANNPLARDVLHPSL